MENIVKDNESKRIARCAGCSEPLNEHQWGIASKFCEGKFKSSPAKPHDHSSIPHPLEIEEIEALEGELAALCLEEERLAQERRKMALRKQIEEKRAKIASATCFVAADRLDPLHVESIKDLRQLPLQDMRTPLDGLLDPLNSTQPAEAQASWHAFRPSPTLPGDLPSLVPPAGLSNAAMESRASEMYLRPAQLPKGEKVLRIIDFVDNIIPREDERTISDGGHTKLIVSYGPKKPKLEQVTFSQWVIANTRIFYNLMISRKLNSLEDIQNYLAYTVKVMELSHRFQWPSVLKYDDEFRLLQATYGYPWSFDCNHLHTVILEPIPKTPTSTRSTSRAPGQSTQFAVTTSEGRTICRSYNSPRGCSFPNCVYEHACNRRVQWGRACGQSHPGHSHANSLNPPLPGTRATPQ